MGRQWLHAKRFVAGLKKAKTNTKSAISCMNWMNMTTCIASGLP
jgi:hypothetical protein